METARRGKGKCVNVDLRPRPLNVISLCTGGAGLDRGLELAIPCARPILYMEREAFAIATLVEAMRQGCLAEAPVWTDAKTFDGRPWRGVVDCVIGGIPCQPHSLAGRKQGSHDERDLWTDARRIIVQSRPWVVVIENVAGMLSAGADQIAGAERVWRDLRKLGFRVEAGLFTASEVGAPHERERIFILAVADNADGRGRDQPTARGRDGREREAGGRGFDVADASGEQRRAGRAGRSGTGDGRPHAQPTRSGDGLQGIGLADALDPRLQGRELGGPSGEWDGAQASRPASELRGTSLVHSPLIGRGEGRAEHELRSGRDAVAVTGEPVGDAAVGDGSSAWQSEAHHGASGQWEHRGPDGGLFPPGPDDVDAWCIIADRAPHLLPAHARHDRFRIAIRNALALAHGDPSKRAWLDEKGPYGLRAAIVQEIAQSVLRRVADGVAANRVDWLRLLGNGVVSLAAAAAIRTLATRAADGGSAGATRLVRMMEMAA